MRFSKILYVVLLYANTFLLIYLLGSMVHLLPPGWTADELTQTLVWYAWIALLVLSVILLIVDAALLLRRSNFHRLVRSMLEVKLAAIPYFIVNFLILAAVMVGVIVGSRGFGIILVWVPFALTYVVFLPTSIYSFAVLLFAHRYHLLRSGGFVVHVLLQFVFVLDLLGTATLWAKCRRYPASTEAPRVTITFPPFDPPVLVPAAASGGDGAAVGAVEATP